MLKAKTLPFSKPPRVEATLCSFLQGGLDLVAFEPEYESDFAYRRAVLRARSVLAAIHFKAGALDSLALPSLKGQPLLLGQSNQLAQAAHDLNEMLETVVWWPSADTYHQKALLPVVQHSKEWRTSYNWLAVLHPQPADVNLVHRWLRSSLPWLDTHSESCRAILKQRGLTALANQEPPEPLTRLFLKALTP